MHECFTAVSSAPVTCHTCTRLAARMVYLSHMYSACRTHGLLVTHVLGLPYAWFTCHTCTRLAARMVYLSHIVTRVLGLPHAWFTCHTCTRLAARMVYLSHMYSACRTHGLLVTHVLGLPHAWFTCHTCTRLAARMVYLSHMIAFVLKAYLLFFGIKQWWSYFNEQEARCMRSTQKTRVREQVVLRADRHKIFCFTI